jgi:hypothetical protein
MKHQCKDCKGASICEHNRIKRTCRECGGSAFCKHNKIKSCCKECGGASICEHGRQKRICKECGGKGICEHGRQKSHCKDCGGSQICEHNKVKNGCRECGGSSMCEHGREKRRCKDCGGKDICEHDKIKRTCIICHPEKACQHCHYVLVTVKSRFAPYCFPCYCQLNPDVEIPKRYMLKENYVREYLKDEFKESITMVFNKQVEDGCSRYRPDVRIDFGSHTVIIECDEHQHRGYDRSCDDKRTMSLFKDCGGRPMVFIRFNPDSYIINGVKHVGCFKPIQRGLSVAKKEFASRMAQVVVAIESVRALPNKEITIERLFYNQ